tara:strand:- start:3118 stop:4005 length:888 start_codon:yes stop_codon:yes gene_type:complete
MNIDELEAKDVSNAAKKVAQKVGAGAKMLGQKIGAKGSGSMMGKAMDKVAAGEALPANLAKQIAPFAKQLETILADQSLRQKFTMLVKQAEKVQKAAAKAQKVAAKAQKATGPGVAAKAAGSIGGAIAKGAKAAAGAVKGAVKGAAPGVAAKTAAPADPKVASTKTAAAGKAAAPAPKAGNLNSYFQNFSKAMKGTGDKKQKIALAKELVNTVADRGGKDSVAAVSILRKLGGGLDNNFKQAAMNALKTGQRLLKQSVYYEINKMLKEHDLSWSDLGMRVHLIEGTNKLVGISLI